MNYWEECISCAMEEAELVATPEQIKSIARFVEIARENYGIMMGHDCVPNPLRIENDRLAKQLDREKRLEHCRECDGSGRVVSHGPYHSSNSQCWKCSGAGKIDPLAK